MSDSDDNVYSTIKDPIVKDMLDFFHFSSEAESENRENSLYDIQFSLGGKFQWDNDEYNDRQNAEGGARPCDSYNDIPQFVHQVTNDQRINMPQTRFAASDDGDVETATVMEDLARAIQTESESEVAIDTAVDFQVRGGWGYWRIGTDYKDEKTRNQIIKCIRIKNTFSVYDDPRCEMQDHSDREELLQVSDIKRRSFNHDYKKAYDSSELQSIGDSQPDWASGDDDTIRIGEYWRVEKTTKSRYWDKESDEEVTLDSDDEYAEDKHHRRDIVKTKVMYYKCTALEVLEKREWPGKYIPYVYLEGESIDIDGKTHRNGLVRGLIAAQKQKNYLTNAIIEAAALTPKAPFILDPKQVEGYTDYWNNANTKNYAWLPAKLRDENGAAYPYPQRVNSEPQIQGLAAMLQINSNNFYSGSGIYPPSLGKQSNESSGKAILARQKEGDVSTFHYTDNTARALRFQGRIFADLFPIIYDWVGDVNLRAEDGTTRKARINEHYTDETSGEQKFFDLTRGTYGVSVTTGASYSTRRQEAQESQVQLFQAAPEAMIPTLPVIVRNMDWPGAEKIAEILEAMAPPQLQAVLTGKKQEIPPQVTAQLQQMQQIIQEGSQQLQAAGQQVQQLEGQIKGKQAEMQFSLQEKQLDAQIKIEQAHAQVAEANRQAVLDQLNYELGLQKLEVAKGSQAIDQQRMQQDSQRMVLDAKIAMAQASPEMALSDPELHGGETPPLMGMMQGLAETLNQGLAAVADVTLQSSQAIIASNQMVAQAIMQPKVNTVQRDANGLLSQVVTTPVQ